jgi:hypothetical protein
VRALWGKLWIIRRGIILLRICLVHLMVWVNQILLFPVATVITQQIILLWIEINKLCCFIRCKKETVYIASNTNISELGQELRSIRNWRVHESKINFKTVWEVKYAQCTWPMETTMVSS